MQQCLAMTIDVEDWFHAENLAAAVPRETWPALESRVETNTQRMLDCLAISGRSATFFVLGMVAERYPALVRRIVADGHELASHGYGHERLTMMSRRQIHQDVVRAKHLMEDIGGVAVLGYRAPCFSITDEALRVLRDAGYRYDSSWYPVRGHDRYGQLTGCTRRDAPTEVLPGFYEVSLSTLSLMGMNWPWAGGGYFRLLPYSIFRAGFRRILNTGGPFVFYLHPWEVDPAQPRPRGVKRSHRFRHYINLECAMSRWERLLSEFRWDRLDRSLLTSQAV